MKKTWKQWLKSALACTLSLIAFASCGLPTTSASQSEEEDNLCTVSFELCTDLETNYIMDQEVEIGDVVMRPSVVPKGENPNNAEVDSWYTDREYTNKWNFLTDTVEGDMTLYAKWVNKYAITYYLGDSETPMFVDYLKEGEIFEKRSDLSDGYKSEGFYLDAEHTRNADTEGVFGQPINGNISIYIDRSDEIYFSGDMMARRFEPRAARSSANVSKPGTIEYVDDGDGGYAKMNFGYSATADSSMVLENVTLDITKSQKLKVTFKNLGKARTLKFYYIAWWDDQSKEPVGGSQAYSETCAYSYPLTEDEKEMSETDEWITKVFDLSGNETMWNGHNNVGIHNGVSLWGNASTLVKLCIDAGYVSENEEDLSNVVLIKSIEGVSAPEYVQTSDTQAVTDMLANDEEAKVQAAANAQQSIKGWIFPKDNANVATSDNVQVYNKENGLLMHADFRAQEAKLTFTTSKENPISLDQLTTLRIRLRNYGYATQLKLTYRNMMSRSATYYMTIDSKTSEVVEYKVNMFGATNWKDKLDTFTISYDSVGNDNAVLFESIEFGEFELIDIPGVNFNDKNTFGLTSNDDLGVKYSTEFGLGTEFEVLKEGVSFEKAITNNTILGYSYLDLTYYKPAEGVDKVLVELTVDGVATTYEFAVAVTEEKEETLRLPLTATGNLEKVKFSFVGTGVIQLNSVKWELDENSSFDFSSSGFVNSIPKGIWAPTLSYAIDSTSAYYARPNTSSFDIVKYYPGYVKENNNQSSLGNLDLNGKTKLVLIYQNQGVTDQWINIGLGISDKTEDDSWKTAHTEVYTAGEVQKQVQTGMKAGEWAAVVIDLTEYANLTSQDVINKKVLTSFILCLHKEGAMSIRALAFI